MAGGLQGEINRTAFVLAVVRTKWAVNKHVHETRDQEGVVSDSADLRGQSGSVTSELWWVVVGGASRVLQEGDAASETRAPGLPEPPLPGPSTPLSVGPYT